MLTGIVIHATIAVVFGLLYGVLLPMLPEIRWLGIPKSLAWGGIVLPAAVDRHQLRPDGRRQSRLQARVDWPWFIASQFVFGAVAAFVVDRSEKIPVPPAGAGVGLRRIKREAAMATTALSTMTRTRCRRCACVVARCLAARLVVSAGRGLRLARPTEPGRPAGSRRPGSGLQCPVRQNCAGCHGADGKLGAAPPLNDRAVSGDRARGGTEQASSRRAGTRH